MLRELNVQFRFDRWDSGLKLLVQEVLQSLPIVYGIDESVIFDDTRPINEFDGKLDEIMIKLDDWIRYYSNEGNVFARDIRLRDRMPEAAFEFLFHIKYSYCMIIGLLKYIVGAEPCQANGGVACYIFRLRQNDYVICMSTRNAWANFINDQTWLATAEIKDIAETMNVSYGEKTNHTQDD